MTYRGEMFSAYNLANLAETYYQGEISAKVWNKPWDSKFLKRMLKGLLEGQLFLIPYDTDKRNNPCLNHGNTAHWCLLKGFIIGTTEKVTLEQNVSCVKQSDYGNFVYFYNLEDISTIELSKDFSPIGISRQTSMSEEYDLMIEGGKIGIREDLVWVITQHGKSKNQCVWRFTDLKASNHNLFTYDRDKEGLKVPPELELLRGKAVILSKYKEDILSPRLQQ